MADPRSLSPRVVEYSCSVTDVDMSHGRYSVQIRVDCEPDILFDVTQVVAPRLATAVPRSVSVTVEFERNIRLNEHDGTTENSIRWFCQFVFVRPSLRLPRRRSQQTVVMDDMSDSEDVWDYLNAVEVPSIPAMVRASVRRLTGWGVIFNQPNP